MKTGISAVRGGGEEDAPRARALRLYLRIGTAAGGLVLLIAAALVANGIIQGRRPVMFVLFGLILTEVGIVFVKFFRKPATRFNWIQRKCTPRLMRVRCMSAGTDGAAVALLYPADGPVGEASPRFRLEILVPDGRENTDSHLESCRVFFDPEHGTPAVIETDDAVYWRRE